MKKTRLIIADDHKIVRMGLKAFLGSYPELELVGEASDGEEALRLAWALNPDVILMDLAMPKLSGVEAIKELKREGHPAKIIILTSFQEKEMALAGIRAGAVGYLMKDAEPKELLEAIRVVMDNKPYLSEELVMSLINFVAERECQEDIDGLTNREKEILHLIVRGFSNKEIAAHLVCSEKTVKTHVSSILQKLKVADRTQAALKAVQKGLV